MKLLQICLLLLLPAVALADYDPEAIKKAITESTSVYQVSDWKPDEKKGGWKAVTALKGMIHVGEQNAGMVEFIGDSTEFVAAMMHCMDFGHIGTGAANKQQRVKVNEVIIGATHHQSKQVTVVNGVRFEVEPLELLEGISLVCILKPETPP